MKLLQKISMAMLFFSVMGNSSAKDLVKSGVDFATKQVAKQVEIAGTELRNPVTLNSDGTIKYCKPTDWRSGFFPGTLWNLYDLTGDAKWMKEAKKFTQTLSEIQYYTKNHDVGFMIYCSYGTGFRLTQEHGYASVIIQAAKSLCTRFHPNAGIIQSWDVKKHTAKKGWICPVIIDNMMNLELLFEASILSGDDSFRKIAISHANKTLLNHFRPDGSTFHVIDYDPNTGDVRHRHTHQGYADSSAWARGQAWAIYGYTMAYRYVRDERYLQQAIKTFNFMKNHKEMPSDCVPYWDMDVPNKKEESRDASSAAIIASALYELATYVPAKEAAGYRQYADKILTSLSSKNYTAKLGENGNFILKHSVSSRPANAEVDVPLNYADYYYLEALKRKRDFERK